MSKPQDFFGASPKTVLNKPFAHFQDQKAYNVDGGSSIADAWTKRTLNTVIHNDIQGASLASDQVSLPAGTYYVEGRGMVFTSANCNFILGIFKDGVKTLQGIGCELFAAASVTEEMVVEGVFTLSSPGVVDLRYYAGQASTGNGLGLSNNGGSITDASIPSIYADLKIWQLDRSLEIAPKAVNAGLQTVPGLNTEGLILGGDVTVSGNTLTISKTSCMASDMVTPLATTADTQVVLPGTINQDFYTFIVRLVADGSFTMKAYTTYAGPSSDVLVDKWRWLDWKKNDGSGVTHKWKSVGGRIQFEVPLTLGTSSGTSATDIDFSSMVPGSVILNYTVQGLNATSGYYTALYNYGVSQILDQTSAGSSTVIATLIEPRCRVLGTEAARNLYLIAVTLRR